MIGPDFGTAHPHGNGLCQANLGQSAEPPCRLMSPVGSGRDVEARVVEPLPNDTYAHKPCIRMRHSGRSQVVLSLRERRGLGDA